jgi:hypothetical protein
MKNRQDKQLPVTASHIMKPEHPLNSTFRDWCGNQKVTKRQARKFLQAHPYYLEENVA